MFKKIILVISFVVIGNTWVYAQFTDHNKNKRVYVISQFSYYKNFRAVAYTIDNGSSVESWRYDTGKAKAYSLQLIAGYFVIPEHFSLGIGVGLDGYHNSPDLNTAPLFIDIRAYFKKGKNTPYAYLNYGNLISSESDTSLEGGNHFRLGVGYKFFLTSKLVMISDISLVTKKIQNVPINKLNVAGIGLNIGFLF